MKTFTGTKEIRDLLLEIDEEGLKLEDQDRQAIFKWADEVREKFVNFTSLVANDEYDAAIDALFDIEAII